jgi:hypothetical protein
MYIQASLQFASLDFDIDKKHFQHPEAFLE